MIATGKRLQTVAIARKVLSDKTHEEKGFLFGVSVRESCHLAMATVCSHFPVAIACVERCMHLITKQVAGISHSQGISLCEFTAVNSILCYKPSIVVINTSFSTCHQ